MTITLPAVTSGLERPFESSTVPTDAAAALVTSAGRIQGILVWSNHGTAEIGQRLRAADASLSQGMPLLMPLLTGGARC